MRFDILDEYSTLVPSGRGVFQRNRAVHYSASVTKALKPAALIHCVSDVKTLLRSIGILDQIKRREVAY